MNNRMPAGALLCLLAALFAWPAPARAVISISQYGITWDFDHDVPSGQFCTGDYWIVGPVKITGITTDIHAAGFVPVPGVDGTMVNPGVTDKQGYDSRLKSYDEKLNAGLINGKPVAKDNPLEIMADSSVVSTASWLYRSAADAEPGTPRFNGGTATPRPVTHAAAVLTVLMKAPAEGSFRPPYSGADKTVRFKASQLDLSKLKNLAPPANTPPLDEMEKLVARPWIDHVNEFLGAMVHPSNNMPQYGRELGLATAQVALMLNLDFSKLPGSPAKTKLLIGYTQLGIDLAGIAEASGGWPANGGHGTGRRLPILVAGLVLNDPHMKDSGNWKTRFQENEQTFYIAQSDVDDTHGADWHPDHRNPHKTPYEKTDIGTAEWGILHSAEPTHDDGDWDAVYRGVNGPVITGITAAVRIMGLEKEWNHPALIDYADRWLKHTGGKAGGGSITPFIADMWNASGAAPVTVPAAMKTKKTDEKAAD